VFDGLSIGERHFAVRSRSTSLNYHVERITKGWGNVLNSRRTDDGHGKADSATAATGWTTQLLRAAPHERITQPMRRFDRLVGPTYGLTACGLFSKDRSLACLHERLRKGDHRQHRSSKVVAERRTCTAYVTLGVIMEQPPQRFAGRGNGFQQRLAVNRDA